MPSQHTTEETATKEGVLVPLDLPELHILHQEWLANGTIRVEVIATATQVACPQCQKMCVKIHDTRERKNVIEACESIKWNSSFTNDALDVSLAEKALPNRIPLVEEGGGRQPACEKKLGGSPVLSL